MRPRLGGLYVSMGFLSIIAHLGMMHWVYRGRFYAADLTPVLVGYRRSMAVARQLFFFSQAWRITGNKACADRAHALYADLTGRFWDHQHDGWFFSLKTGADAHTPADPRKDTYGHAFVIFALAEYGAVFGKPAAIDWARRTLEIVKQRLLTGAVNFRKLWRGAFSNNSVSAQ